MSNATALEIRPHVEVINGGIRTNSIKIAEHFSKRHGDVLRAVKQMDCSPEFNQRNFAPAEYIDAKGEKRPYYEITRDGFTFIAMGFTGKEAARWKEAYIEAFNAMERSLTHPKYALKDLRTKKAFPGGLTLDQQDSIKEVLRLRLENIPADKRAKASVTYWSALKSKFGVQTYKLIPPEHHTEAVSIAGRVTLEGELLPRDPDDTLSSPRRIPRAQHPGYAHARDHLNNLRAWGQDALPPRVHQDFDAELRELERSLISGWTEIDEALMRMAVSMAMLKRWHNGH